MRWTIQKPQGTCRWFLKCRRAAALTRPHPRLGDVAICRECNAYVNHLEQGTAETLAALERYRQRRGR